MSRHHTYRGSAPEVISQRVTEELATAIQATGITHRELGRRIGIAQASVSRRLSGHSSLSFDMFQELCEAADLDPRDVLRKVTGGYQGWVAA